MPTSYPMLYGCPGNISSLELRDLLGDDLRFSVSLVQCYSLTKCGVFIRSELKDNFQRHLRMRLDSDYLGLLRGWYSPLSIAKASATLATSYIHRCHHGQACNFMPKRLSNVLLIMSWEIVPTPVLHFQNVRYDSNGFSEYSGVQLCHRGCDPQTSGELGALPAVR